MGPNISMVAQAQAMLHNIGTIANILNVVAIMMGLGLFLAGLFQFKKYGEARTQMSSQHSIAAPLAMVISGVFLLILPYTITSSLLAFWGPGQTMPLAYQGPTSYDIDVYIPVVLAFLRLIGVGAIIRALVLFSKLGAQGQPGTMGKAVMHLIGGILCVHILGTVQLVEFIFDL